MTPLILLFSLLFWHCLADYPLQGDFLSKAKNHTNPIPGVPFYQALGAHSLIQGAGVAVLTGNLWLGCAEAVTHAIIDYLKCDGKLTYNQDQFIHVGCKVIWVMLAIALA